MRRWQCTVCKYIHEGDEPPEKCPVCKVGREKFVEIEPEPAPESGGKGEERPGGLAGLVSRHHLHPMSVHVPNGIVPAAVVFVVLAVALEMASLGEAAFFNLVFVLVTMPVVILSGIVEWRVSYSGALTSSFGWKLVLSGVVLVSATGLVVWRLADPEVLSAGSAVRFGYLAVHFVMLLATSLAGFIGGKLVFKD